MIGKSVSQGLASAATLIYRQLLRFYPSEFRDCYGAGMERMFREQIEEARGKWPIWSVPLLLGREILGILRTASVQRFAKLRTRKPANAPRRSVLGIIEYALFCDLRHAVRSTRRKPGYALTVVVQLGIGIGATTATLSVVDNVLLQRLPYPHADELVVFSNPGHSFSLYSDWRDRTNSFSAVAAVWNEGRGLGISGDGVPESVPGVRVTGEFFQLFGVTALHGRLLVDADYDATSPSVAVVSHRLWQRRGWGAWGEGRTITVDGNPTEVVGVLDPAFQVPEELVGRGVDVWLPLTVPTEVAQLRTWNALRVVARKKTGLSTEAAQTDVDALAVLLAREHALTDRLSDGSPRLYRVVPLIEAMVGGIEDRLYTLLGAVCMMLLIACVNVTNLNLARETTRTREMAVRSALGAGRGRIVAQLLTEGLLLAFVSGVIGVLLAVAGVQTFEMLNPGGLPRVQHITIDARLLGFALLASVVSAVVSVLAPAIVSTRPSVAVVLRATESGVTSAPKPTTLRKMLVIGELATGLMLLVGAGLLFHSFIRLRNVDGGFDPENVLAMPLDLRAKPTGEQRIQFTDDLVHRLRAIPGVEMVGAGFTLPPYRQGRCCWFGNMHTETNSSDPQFTMLHPVTPGYFDVLGATVLRGRGFADADRESGSVPAVINETLARRLFGQANPLGKAVLVEGNRWTVIGIVNDMRHWGLRMDGGANAYVPYALFGGISSSLQVAVKSQLDPTVLSSAMRDAVWAIDANLPIREVTQLRHNVASSVAEPRFLSILMTTFAALAILLAAGGTYAFMTFAVRQRSREFGIRVALGAKKGDLVRIGLRSALLLTLYGSALGLAGAFALSRLLGSVLYGISPTDPIAFLGAATVLVTAALTASYVPLHRASKMDAVDTLRTE